MDKPKVTAITIRKGKTFDRFSCVVSEIEICAWVDDQCSPVFTYIPLDYDSNDVITKTEMQIAVEAIKNAFYQD